jgi:ArsR family transcriptional regulator
MKNAENDFYRSVGGLFKEISPPARIKILLAIGEEEVCVCHLEASLRMKQAYLSQHLMALRKAGILITNREGRFIYYRLANTVLLTVIQTAAKVLDIQMVVNKEPTEKNKCPCPKCSGNPSC